MILCPILVIASRNSSVIKVLVGLMRFVYSLRDVFSVPPGTHTRDSNPSSINEKNHHLTVMAFLMVEHSGLATFEGIPVPLYMCLIQHGTRSLMEPVGE